MEKQDNRKADRRSVHDRRVFSYNIYFPERRIAARRQFTRRQEDKN